MKTTRRKQRQAKSQEVKSTQGRGIQQLQQTSTPLPIRLLQFQSQQKCPVNPSSWPPAVLKGANGFVDALRGPPETIPYIPCTAVHSSREPKVTFRQESGNGTLHVHDGCLQVIAPGVSMTMKGVLQPTWEDPPPNAAEWKIGILQVLQKGSCCRRYYGRTVNESEYLVEDYFSKSQTDKEVNDLPLIDRMTNDNYRQKQTVNRFDPAYCLNASSLALLQQVYDGETVYCQLSMEDQPTTAIVALVYHPSHDPNGPKYYLNRIEKKCHFTTMICIYKPGLASKSVYPLYAVDWYFNFAANRDKTQPDNFVYTPTKLRTVPFVVTSFNNCNIARFECECIENDQCVKTSRDGKKCLETTFESPNNAQQWRTIKLDKLQKVHSRETYV